MPPLVATNAKSLVTNVVYSASNTVVSPARVNNTMTDLGLGSVIRDSVGFYKKVGEPHLLLQSGTNAARFESQGLLIEPRRLNKVTAPRDVGGASWTYIDGCTSSGGKGDPYIETPTNIKEAWRIDCGKAADNKGVQQTISSLANVPAAASVYCSYGGIAPDGGQFPATITSGGSTTLMDDPRTIVGDDLYGVGESVWVQHRTTFTISGGAAILAPVDKTSGVIADANVVAQIKVWGAQLEYGGYPTSLTSSERAPETALWGGGNYDDPSEYQNAGAFYIQGITLADNADQVYQPTNGVASGSTFFVGCNEAFALSKQLILLDVNGDWAFGDDTDPKQVINAGQGHLSKGDTFKLLLTWDATKVYLYINGVKIGEQTRAGQWEQFSNLCICPDVTSGFSPTFGHHLQGWAQYRNYISESLALSITTEGVSGIG